MTPTLLHFPPFLSLSLSLSLYVNYHPKSELSLVNNFNPLEFWRALFHDIRFRNQNSTRKREKWWGRGKNKWTKSDDRSFSLFFLQIMIKFYWFFFISFFPLVFFHWFLNLKLVPFETHAQEGLKYKHSRRFKFYPLYRTRMSNMSSSLENVTGILPFSFHSFTLDAPFHPFCTCNVLSSSIPLFLSLSLKQFFSPLKTIECYPILITVFVRQFHVGHLSSYPSFSLLLCIFPSFSLSSFPFYISLHLVPFMRWCLCVSTNIVLIFSIFPSSSSSSLTQTMQEKSGRKFFNKDIFLLSSLYPYYSSLLVFPSSRLVTPLQEGMRRSYRKKGDEVTRRKETKKELLERNAVVTWVENPRWKSTPVDSLSLPFSHTLVSYTSSLPLLLLPLPSHPFRPHPFSEENESFSCSILYLVKFPFIFLLSK